MRTLKRITLFCLPAVALSITIAHSARAQSALMGGTRSRIKEIAKFEGTRTNQLTGLGLVTGLAGTGGDSQLTTQMIKNVMDNLGVSVPVKDIAADNTAAVMVTATLPAFARGGDRIDVTVSSIDGSSLMGGTLIQTPLQAANGETYVVAAGSVSIGGFSVSGGGGGRQKGFTTVGTVPGGGSVERDLPVEILQQDFLFLNLNHSDFTTASRVAETVNKTQRAELAKALTASSIRIQVPEQWLTDVVGFISEIENLTVEQDQVGKIVVNERTGTIIIGGDVRVGPAAIAHGSLRIKIEPKPVFSAGGGTLAPPPQVVQTTELGAEEPKASFRYLDRTDFESVKTLVDTLNEMGVTPTDVIAILQALKTEGALQAEIVFQ